MIHVILDIGTQVAKVEVHVIGEEGVLVSREDDLAEFRTNVWDTRKGNTAIGDGEKVVYHGLVCPLCKKWCYRIVATVED